MADSCSVIKKNAPINFLERLSTAVSHGTKRTQEAFGSCGNNGVVKLTSTLIGGLNTLHGDLARFFDANREGQFLSEKADGAASLAHEGALVTSRSLFVPSASLTVSATMRLATVGATVSTSTSTSLTCHYLLEGREKICSKKRVSLKCL
jgi:hypothetical protein